MGIGIFSSNSNVRTLSIKDKKGNTVGSISITKSNKKKRKRLQYNFKNLSTKILMSKTAGSANKAAITARTTIGILERKLKSGDYDEEEIELAIIHARKMERIAKKRMKHLEEEERAKQTGTCLTDKDEKVFSELENTKEELSSDIEEELRQLMKEMQELMEESLEELMNETGLDELADELMGMVQVDVTPDELERLKKKHRSNELMEIIDADMKYLKAMFQKYEREKQAASSSSSGSDNNSSCVSLQLSGMEISVETPETPPVLAEGGNVDLSV